MGKTVNQSVLQPDESQTASLSKLRTEQASAPFNDCRRKTWCEFYQAATATEPYRDDIRGQGPGGSSSGDRPGVHKFLIILR
jgi:hypothetical protein